MTESMMLLGMPGWQELLLILIIVLAIFGGSKLAGIGRGLGEGIRNFRQGLKGEDEKDSPPATDPTADKKG
jgi:sec-independent protein translocase protein TatA